VVIHTAENKVVRDWKDALNVKYHEDVGVDQGLQLAVAVNEYEGELRILVVKATEKGFAKSVMSLSPDNARLLARALPKAVDKVKEIRKAVIAEKVKSMIAEAREAGVDINELLK